MPPVTGELGHRCGTLIAAASALREQLPAQTRRALAPLLEQVNCYYSNLIEGHHTYPDEVEQVLTRARAGRTRTPVDRVEGTRRSAAALAIEGAAHVETQRLLTARLREDPTWDPTAVASLREVHRWFIERLPEEFRFAETRSGSKRLPIMPGGLRDTAVTVGDHLPPEHQHLPAFLEVFHTAYAAHTTYAPEAIVRIAAAHHRLVWIHPFIDGNGRVARLMTDAMLERAQLGSDGLWRLSRGFARSHEQYKRMLAAADEQRHHATDGRGNLSQAALAAWCDYLIGQATDQAEFMFQLINPPALRARIMRWAARTDRTPQTGRLLCEVMVQGTIDRGTATQILGVGERHARRLIDQLVADDLLVTKAHGPLLPRVPLHLAPHWFPDLFPSGIEMRLEERGAPSRGSARKGGG